jgi:hypothetical protein
VLLLLLLLLLMCLQVEDDPLKHVASDHSLLNSRVLNALSPQFHVALGQVHAPTTTTTTTTATTTTTTTIAITIFTPADATLRSAASCSSPAPALSPCCSPFATTSPPPGTGTSSGPFDA